MTHPNELVDDEALEADLSVGREGDDGWEILPSPSTDNFLLATGRCRKRKSASGDDLDPHEANWWDDLEELARSTRTIHKRSRAHKRRNR